MEYELHPDPHQQVALARFSLHKTQNLNKVERFNLFQGEHSLETLGQLADAADSKLIKWVSQWGLLGFRRLGPEPPLIGGEWTVSSELGNEEDERVGLLYEPVELIRQAARVARAATTVLHALTAKKSLEERAVLIQEAIRVFPQRPNWLESPDGECERFVQRVSIGIHKRPTRAVDWECLAVRGLGRLADQYLRDEFRLRWSMVGKTRRIPLKQDIRSQIHLGWEVRSLLGALFIRMGLKELRDRRNCRICEAPIADRRAHAKTCSDVCRQRLRRQKKETHRQAMT